MAEPKRLQFTTVSPPNTEEKKKTPQICHRFTLSLSASTDTTCPEFSYTDLVKSKLTVKKDTDKPPNTDESSKTNPFGDDEDADEIAALAKKFEEKYGHMDLGEGYDETDEFIDNSEAFDEVLPSYLQTKLGGFYINSGKLDFKEVEDDSREEFQTPVKKKKKKRLITSDSESDEEEKKKKVKKRKLKDGIEGEKKKKKHLLNGDTEKAFKKPKKPLDKEKMKKKKMSPTVAELLKQQTESTSNTPSLTNGVTNPDTETHSPSMIDGNDSSSDVVMTNKEDSNSRDIEEDKKTIDPAAIPKLPSGLTPELEQNIEKLKEEAAKNSSVGKSKFFTSAVNKMLLEVEMGCRQLSCGNRSSVYAYLAVYLPCGKETLKTRAKKLRENMESDLLKEPMQKLKEALGKVLPPMLEKYEAECQKLAQLRSQEKEKVELKEDKEGEEDMESEEKSNTEANKKKLPPKKFEWTNEIRVLLCDIVRIKLGIYDSSKTRVLGAEEFLKNFLDREIKSLWPKVWMQTRVLFRESKIAHAPWTMQKPKKTVIITKTTPTVVSAPTTPASSLISKTLTPNSVGAKTPVGEVSMKQDKSTPSLPVAARSNIPTILDYADKDTPQKSSSTTTASSSKSDTTVATGSKSSSAATGLSLLAASAAKQQYLERSWDHVVSDILRTSLTQPDGKAPQGATKVLSAGDGGGSFLAAFEKYASSTAEDKMKNPKVENSGSLIAQQPKSGTAQYVNLKSVSDAFKQNQNQLSSKDVGVQQQKSSVLLQQTKQLQQKQVMDRLKMASQQNIDNKQINPNSSPTQQKVVKAIKITPQQQQMIQKVGQSMPKSGQAVISVSTSKGGGQHVSLLNKDHIYKQLLESGVQGLGQFKSPSQISPTSARNTQDVPATIILTSSSGKTPQQKVTSVSLTKVVSGNSNSGNSQRPSTGQITSSQILRTSPVSVQRSAQGQIPSPTVSGQRTSPGQISPSVSGQRTPSQVHHQSSSVSLNSANSKVMYNNSNGQNRNSGTASNLLQQLFDTNSSGSSHSVPKQMTSPVGLQRSPQKSQGPQIWSMSSIATSASNSGKSGGYNMANVIPKPVPGYQSVRIGSISKDLVSPGQLQRTSMHAQGSYGGTPTSPISTAQQNPLGNPRIISGQTSPLRHPAPHDLFPPPYTANSLQQQQHTVTSYPSATYRSYTEKSRSPHGY